MVNRDYLNRLDSLKSVLKNGALKSLHQIVSIIKSFPEGDSLYEYLEEGYVRLFISAREGIVAPLYESCYEFEGAPLMGKAATEMRERFAAKGLAVADNIKEPPDHVSIELEYLYFLLDKGWRDHDTGLIGEASAFASNIMIPWVSEFQTKLSVEKQCIFYPLISSVLIELLHIIAEGNSID